MSDTQVGGGGGYIFVPERNVNKSWKIPYCGNESLLKLISRGDVETNPF